MHYVAARLLWDHTVDVPALLEEFYQKFYAEAAAPMKRYHEALERQVATCGKHFPGNAPVFAATVFTEPLLAELQGSLDEAARIATHELVKRRIEKIALSTQYAARLSEYFRLRDRALKLPAPQQKEALGEAIQKVATLRSDVVGNRARYEGVASGSYMSGDLLLAREIKTLQAKVEGRQSEPPPKRGKKKR